MARLFFALLILAGCTSGGYNPSYIISEGDEATQTSPVSVEASRKF